MPIGIVERNWVKEVKNPNSQWVLNPGTLYSLSYTLPLELPLVDFGILDLSPDFFQKYNFADRENGKWGK